MPTLTINNRRAPCVRLLAILGWCSALAAAPALAQAGSTASGPCPRRTTPRPATASSPRSPPANATRLRPVWTFSTGVLAGHQGQPLVVKNTMYVVTP